MVSSVSAAPGRDLATNSFCSFMAPSIREGVMICDDTFQVATSVANGQVSATRQGIATVVRRAARCLIALLAVACAGEAFAGGTDYIWDGGANNGDWSSANNWGANTVPTNDSQANLRFAGTVQLSTTNTLSGTYALRTIAFDTGAGAFTLWGNAVSVANNAVITNNSSNLQTINLALINMTGGGPIIAATSGNLVISSSLASANNFSFTAGAGFGTTLSGSSAHAVQMTVTSGFLRIQNAGALGGTGGITSVSSGAALQLDGVSIGAEPLTINGGGIAGASGTGALRNLSGTNTFAGAVTFGSAATIGADANTQLNLTGGQSGNSLKTYAGAGNITASGTISGNAGMTMAGSGTLTLSAGNTVTGAFSVNSGVVRATTNAGALGAGTLTLGGGNLELANDSGLNFARNTTVSTSGTIFSERLTSGAGVTHTLGTLGIGAQTLTLAKDATVTSGTAGLTFGTVTLSADGATFNATAGTLLTLGAVGGNTFDFTVNGEGDTNITGIIGTTTGGLTKAGAGRLTLSAANTYTGTTQVTGGTLAIGAGGSLAVTPLTVNGASATFDIGSISDTIGAVTLTDGSIVGTTGTLTGASYAVSNGSISAILGGAVALTKSTSGTVTLSG
ncbi:MAG: hypothetical protein EBZ59_08455, partial [Planctomycetia bacterium]|nr:hypothetical protein [Planctomycetia bacterium]